MRKRREEKGEEEEEEPFVLSLTADVNMRRRKSGGGRDGSHQTQTPSWGHFTAFPLIKLLNSEPEKGPTDRPSDGDVVATPWEEFAMRKRKRRERGERREKRERERREDPSSSLWTSARGTNSSKKEKGRRRGRGLRKDALAEDRGEERRGKAKTEKLRRRTLHSAK